MLQSDQMSEAAPKNEEKKMKIKDKYPCYFSRTSIYPGYRGLCDTRQSKKRRFVHIKIPFRTSKAIMTLWGHGEQF